MTAYISLARYWNGLQFFEHKEGDGRWVVDLSVRWEQCGSDIAQCWHVESILVSRLGQGNPHQGRTVQDKEVPNLSAFCTYVLMHSLLKCIYTVHDNPTVYVEHRDSVVDWRLFFAVQPCTLAMDSTWNQITWPFAHRLYVGSIVMVLLILEFENRPYAYTGNMEWEEQIASHVSHFKRYFWH